MLLTHLWHGGLQADRWASHLRCSQWRAALCHVQVQAHGTAMMGLTTMGWRWQRGVEQSQLVLLAGTIVAFSLSLWLCLLMCHFLLRYCLLANSCSIALFARDRSPCASTSKQNGWAFFESFQ